MEQITIKEVNDRLSANIVLAHYKSESLIAQLVYRPYTEKYNVYINGKPVWEVGNRDKIYVVARYNQILAGKSCN